MAETAVNYDSEPIPTGNEHESQTEIAKCPSCGANLTFSPTLKCLICDYCKAQVKIDLTKYGEEIDFANLLRTSNEWSEEARVYVCNNCGAKHILSKTQISTHCSFCGATNVVETKDIVGLKPNAVLPFSIDKDTAMQKVKIWAKKKLFAPQSFRKKMKPEEIDGIYTPAFTFDTETFSNYSGRLGKHYYVTVTRNGKSYQEQRTKYFNVSGTGFLLGFNDILIHASDSIDKKNSSKINPFDTERSNAYSNNFLHGFSAGQYTRDGQVCWGEAKLVIRERVRAAILRQYDYDVVDNLNVGTECHNITYKYMLLPVYVGHSKFNKKIYKFYMNGRNGKISGKTPVSWLKVLITSLAGAAVAVGAFLLYYFFIYL